MTETTSPPLGWRTPTAILVAGCVIAALGFGLRSSLGLFMTPISVTNGWGRDVFSVAIALQSLLWGVAQPLAGALADKFGIVRVLWFGAFMYAAGLMLMPFATTPGELYLTAGLLVGIGIAFSSFGLVIAAFGKLLSPERRTLGFGLGTAAGSFGQFFLSPLAIALQHSVGWQETLLVFGGTMVLVLPLAFVLSVPKDMPIAGELQPQSLSDQLRQALGHRSFILLVVGFFTCGFQLQFITAHLPAYLVDKGLSADIGGWTVATIGLFNIVGSVTAGWLGNRMPKRYLLAIIYTIRAAAVLAFVMFPVTPFSALVFAAVMGLMWLSTVPPTSGLILVMFGPRWLATLSGIAFLSHQVGSFIGVWLGGVVYDRTGNYDMVWYLSILLGLFSALINLPIVEQPAPRQVAVAAA